MTRTWRYQWQDDEEEERVREEAGIRCLDPSLTQQQFTEDCDLNVIAKRYGLDDGSIPPAQIGEIHDFTEIPDFRTAHDILHQAQERFMQLPAEIRTRFANRADIMHDWVLDPTNYEEATRLGFIAPATPAATGGDSSRPATTSGNASPNP